MKKILALISAALVLISVCVIFLIKQGISLRPEGLITPSVITENFQNVSPALISRLFPKFQESDLVVFGWLPSTTESQNVFEGLQQEYQKSFHHPVTVLDFVQNPNEELLKACPRPCWVLVPRQNAHQLTPNSFIDVNILPTKKTFFTITWVPFILDQPVPENCLAEKRLDFACFKLLSVQRAQKKIKAKHRYFFMNSYNDVDQFLFIQDEKK